MDKQRKNTTWIDAGHFHNRGPILECMAALAGSKVAFVRIRRNRHDIANSFIQNWKTPCFPFSVTKERIEYLLHGTKIQHFIRNHPGRSYCPVEKDGTTPISLSVNKDTWKQLTPFQKFLWQADDLEIRFQNLKTKFPQSHYLEVTFSNGEEFTKGLQDIRTQLGCKNLFEKAPDNDRHKHTSGEGSRNCTYIVSQDLEYQRLVQYTDEQKHILYHQYPQAVNINKCMETKEQIQNVINDTLSSNEWLGDWVYE